MAAPLAVARVAQGGQEELKAVAGSRDDTAEAEAPSGSLPHLTPGAWWTTVLLVLGELPQGNLYKVRGSSS